jgi:uncharacterized protein YjaG (DUF416 family)
MYPDLNPKHLHIPSYNMALQYSELYKDNDIFKRLFDSVANYYLYVEYTFASKVFHDLLIEKIRSIRPDAIVIDLNEFSFQNDSDIKFYGIKNSIEHCTTYYDLRHCHLSREKHKILADELDAAIQHQRTSISYDNLLNVSPGKKFDEYFRPMTHPAPSMLTYKEHIKVHSKK